LPAPSHNTAQGIGSRPVFIVLVRPSRHTYSRLEEVSAFTVNVPPPEPATVVSHCGTVSGRDRDKFKEMGVTPIPSREVRAPIIKEWAVHYECRTLHRNDLLPDNLTEPVREESYANGDFYCVYFGSGALAVQS